MHFVLVIILVLFIGYGIGSAVRYLKAGSYFLFGLDVAIAIYFGILLFKYVLQH